MRHRGAAIIYLVELILSTGIILQESFHIGKQGVCFLRQGPKTNFYPILAKIN